MRQHDRGFPLVSTLKGVIYICLFFPFGSGTLNTWTMSLGNTNNSVFPNGTFGDFLSPAVWKAQ